MVYCYSSYSISIQPRKWFFFSNALIRNFHYSTINTSFLVLATRSMVVILFSCSTWYDKLKQKSPASPIISGSLQFTHFFYHGRFIFWTFFQSLHFKNTNHIKNTIMMWAKFSLYLEMILKLAAPSPNLSEIIRLNNNRLSFRHHKKYLFCTPNQLP